jgi:hypothetical protein
VALGMSCPFWYRVCMKYCSWGVSRVVSFRGLSVVIKWSMGPYSCRLCRVCWAYVDCRLLCLMYRICSWKRSFRLQLVWPTYASMQVVQVSLYIPLLLQYVVLLSAFGFMSREILLLHLMQFLLLCA